MKTTKLLQNFFTVILLLSFKLSIASDDLLPIADAERECNAGKMQGCGDLTMHYLNNKNLIEAKKLAKRACDADILRGRNVMGIALKSENTSEAENYFKKSCEANNQRGCMQLGMLFYENDKKSKGIKLLKSSCASNEFAACQYYGAVIVDEDIAEAKRVFKKNCDQGVLESCTNLGRIYFKEGNMQEAEVQWSKSCIDDYMQSSGCEPLRSLYQSKARLYETACEQGDMSGCYSWAKLYDESPEPVKLSVINEPYGILEHYKKACRANEPKACEGVKNTFRNKCTFKKKWAVEDCWSQVRHELSAGSAVIERVWINSERCGVEAKKIEESNDCVAVGDYYANSGEYDQAAKVYSASCNAIDSSGCEGLSCVGFIKVIEGKLKEADKFFKVACSHSHIGDSHENLVGRGCYTTVEKLKLTESEKKEMPQWIKEGRQQMPIWAQKCRDHWKITVYGAGAIF